MKKGNYNSMGNYNSKGNSRASDGQLNGQLKGN
jgi:hypothetical protein